MTTRYGYELVAACRCLTCLGACTSLVPKRWFQCNPCSKGYHEAPCEGFVEDRPAHLIVECKRCGYERGEHVGEPEKGPREVAAGA